MSTGTIMVNRVTTDVTLPSMKLAFLMILAFLARRYSYQGQHNCKVVRDGEVNQWVGDLSDNLRKRVNYRLRGDRHLYSLAFGKNFRGGIA